MLCIVCLFACLFRAFRWLMSVASVWWRSATSSIYAIIIRLSNSPHIYICMYRPQATSHFWDNWPRAHKDPSILLYVCTHDAWHSKLLSTTCGNTKPFGARSGYFRARSAISASREFCCCCTYTYIYICNTADIGDDCNCIIASSEPASLAKQAAVQQQQR